MSDPFGVPRVVLGNPAGGKQPRIVSPIEQLTGVDPTWYWYKTVNWTWVIIAALVCLTALAATAIVLAMWPGPRFVAEVGYTVLERACC